MVCGSWRVGGRRVKRRIGPKRQSGRSDGLTRAMAERELQRRILTEKVVVTRRTVHEAGNAYVEHLEHVMERKRTTIEGLPRVPAPASDPVLRR